MVAAGHWAWASPEPALPGVPGIPLTNYAGWLLVVALVMVAALDRLVPRRRRGAGRRRRAPRPRRPARLDLARLGPGEPGASSTGRRSPARGCSRWASCVLPYLVRGCVRPRLPRGAPVTARALAAAPSWAGSLARGRADRAHRGQPAGAAGAGASRRRSASGSACSCRSATRSRGSAAAWRRSCEQVGVAGPGDPRPGRRVHRRHRRRRPPRRGRDPRVRLLPGDAAAARLARQAERVRASSPQAATGSVLVFLDADVRLAPHAVAATVDLLRRDRPRPGQPLPAPARADPGRAAGAAAAAVVVADDAAAAAGRDARRGPRSSAANGQLLAVDAGGYAAAGGHGAVRAEVLDDVALLRAVKARRRHGGVVDGTRAGHLPDVRRLGRPPRRATPSRCGRRSAPRPGPRPRSACSAPATSSPPWPRCAAPGRPRRLRCGGAGRYVVAERTGGRSLPDSLRPPRLDRCPRLADRAVLAPARRAATSRGRAGPCPAGR